MKTLICHADFSDLCGTVAALQQSSSLHLKSLIQSEWNQEDADLYPVLLFQKHFTSSILY